MKFYVYHFNNMVYLLCISLNAASINIAIYVSAFIVSRKARVFAHKFWKLSFSGETIKSDNIKSSRFLTNVF